MGNPLPETKKVFQLTGGAKNLSPYTAFISKLVNSDELGGGSGQLRILRHRNSIFFVTTPSGGLLMVMFLG